MAIDATKKLHTDEPEAQSLRVLTVGQVADLLQVGRPAVRRLLRTGQLKGTRVGRVWRIRIAAVEDFLGGDLGKLEIPLVQALKGREEADDGRPWGVSVNAGDASGR